MKDVQVDVAIIGAGTAGMTAYRSVVRAGKTALLIEDGPYGTTCARVGCMPSKLLIAAADAAHAVASASAFGVHIDGKVRIDGAEVMQRVKRERDRFVSFVLDDVEAIDEKYRLRGTASFIDGEHLGVGGHTRVRAKAFVIATGSSPVIPGELTALGDRAIVNDDVFYWDDLPRSIAILGSGVVGIELGQALARLGVEVTVINRSENLAGMQDPAVRKAAREAFEPEFTMMSSTTVQTATRLTKGVELQLKNGDSEFALQADLVLCATGRQANLSALSLERTSAALDEKGMPEFDPATLQIKTDSSSSALFFAGDVNGLSPVLHEAADDGRFAGENAVRWPEPAIAHERRAPMGIVFSDPQIMSVGTRFKQLPGDVLIGEVSYVNQGRARVMLKNTGMLRVYADARTEQFLGAEMAGPAAEHTAHLLAWCLQQKLTISQMLAMPFYHPVTEEGLRTALRGARKKD
ncbi:dihydrolipoyl dehydrogenase [Paenalcaligenes niemegkensis]|uniref:dihydrolipoyl dehydrogenase n=1 Tax=Paenalcaligenes niemegkensis TaxID=2895469 RepID=UPI001EE82B6E|nr:dihydrolipoyl dehydrogenase [Paenalcaligenes niemegkensis]MCQ9616271.1 dihydrolipoyl dehydrogenase [Paenalcaligenes niemegkensis]